MPTSAWPSLSARRSVSAQPIASAAPEVATPSASGPMARATASQEPRSDQGPAKGTTASPPARAVLSCSITA